MYPGYINDLMNFGILCNITRSGCNAYEEVLMQSRKARKINEEYKPREEWTEEKIWKLSLQKVRSCPSNRMRHKLEELANKREEEIGETKVEKKFFDED